MFASSPGLLCVNYTVDPPSLYQAQGAGKTTWQPVGGTVNQATLIKTGTAAASSAPGPLEITFTVAATYSAYMVVVTAAATGWVPYCAAIFCTTGGSTNRYAAPFAKAPLGTTESQAIIPAALVARKPGYVRVYYGGSTSSVAYRLYGLAQNPGIRMRSDGRAYPIGAFRSSVACGTAVSTNPIVSAPASPLRVYVHHASLNVVSWHGTGSETGYKLANITIGTTQALLIAGAYNGSANQETAPEGGILGTVATAVRLHTETNRPSFCYAAVSYDLIV